MKRWAILGRYPILAMIFEKITTLEDASTVKLALIKLVNELTDLEKELNKRAPFKSKEIKGE